MVLALKVINAQTESQDFILQLKNLEASLDAVSSIVAKGNCLLSVTLIDQKSIIPLPIDAFDGQPLSIAIQQLEQQWKRILSQPVKYRLPLQDIVHKRIQLHSDNIIKLEQAVHLAKQRLDLVNNGKSHLSNHPFILAQLETTLTRFQTNLIVEKASLHRYTVLTANAKSK